MNETPGPSEATLRREAKRRGLRLTKNSRDRHEPGYMLVSIAHNTIVLGGGHDAHTATLDEIITHLRS